MRVSLAIGALTFYPVASTFAIAESAGADGVELLASPAILRRGPEHYARMALDYGVPILTVHSLLQFRDRGIDRKIEADVASIEFAAAIPTCEMIVLHPPMTGQRPSPILNRWLEAISRARAESANPRLRLGLENRGENGDGVETQMLDDPMKLRRLVGEWDMSVTLDLAHAASHGTDLFEAVECCLPRLANVHLSDAKVRSYRGGVRNGLFRDHQVPGEGVLPLAAVVSTLQLGGYSGPLTIELSPMSLRAFWPWSARSRARLATARTREMIASDRSVEVSRTVPRPLAPRREETHDDA